MAITQPRRPNRDRKRFIFWFFIAGAIVSLIFTIFDLLILPKTNWQPLEPLYMWVVLAIYPTVLLLLDAEHAPDIIAVVLLLAAPLNGALYAIVGYFVWCFREWALKRSAKRTHL
jgi:hypothetical protein